MNGFSRIALGAVTMLLIVQLTLTILRWAETPGAWASVSVSVMAAAIAVLLVVQAKDYRRRKK